VRNFYAQPKAHWSGSSTKQEMRYHKLAAEWRRLGRRFSAESGSSELRLWDCRKLVEKRPSGRVGVLAFLFEANDDGRKYYVGYYGTLSELAGLKR
jgi:hypothetical protein